jgi:arylsulfatase A-like enzyme
MPWIVLFWSALIACSPKASEPTTPAAASPERAQQIQQIEPRERASETTLARGRLRYDLARHLDRAELFEGRARVIDLRTRGGAKYTSGGWLSHMRADLAVGGDETGAILGRSGRLQLPAESDEAAVVVMHVRAPGPGSLRAFVGGDQIAEVEVPRDAFRTVRFEIPAGTLSTGDNTLLLRTGSSREVAGVGRVGLFIKWAKVAPADAPPSEEEPPAPRARLGEHPALSLGSGERLGYAFEVPAAARLRGVVAGEGRLEITAERDGSPATPLGRFGEGVVDVDLSSLEGELVRLDLEASEGDVIVGRPSVVTLDADGAAERPRRPDNVLVYLIDTLRADKLHAYQPESRVRAPGLDRFTAGATTFLRGHTQENWTKPSVATLLSGLMPWQHTAVTGESVVPRSVTLLPEMLKEHGFYTGSFIANGYVSQAFGFRQGWDTYRNYIRENRRTDAEHVAADVLSWLDDRPDDQPFLLYVHTIDPHVPYRPPNEFLQMYEETPYRGPLSFRRDATLLGNIKTGRTRTTAADRAHLEALYDGEISYHDVHFAAILDGLERRGLDESTMIVVTADHGEEFWDHGSVGHGHSVYEELLHIPFFIRLPGLEPTEIGTPVGLSDVIPTILDALGKEIPEDLAGRSLLPALLRGEESAPGYTISGFMENWRAIVIGRTKLIQRTTHAPRIYDLATDPNEEEDLATERPLAVRSARGLLGLAMAATDDRHRARTRQRHRPESIQIDSELEAHLEALGYVQ